MSKATHRGHCQACGRLQMLPGGRLSLHGYNVTHGFFSGTCVGSKELPFELSCGLVKQFITSAQHQLESLERFQATLRAPATEAKAWFCTYKANPRGRYYTRVRAWEEVTVTQQTIQFRDGQGSYNKFERTGDTKWEGRDRAEVVPDVTEVHADYNATLLEVCTKANGNYAAWLEHEAVSLRRYIAWQTERVENWKEMPVFPIEHKDKLGFEPTKAPY